MIGSNEQGQGKRHHKQIELLAIAYVLLSSCFFFIHYFSFFFSTFFSLILLIYIFFQKGAHKNKPQKKIGAQLDKRWGLYKIRIVLSNACQTCRPQNSVFLIEFCNSNFFEPSNARMEQI